MSGEASATEKSGTQSGIPEVATSKVAGINELKKLMVKKNYNQGIIARKMGASITVVSQVLRNRYTGNITKIEKKIQDVLEREQVRAKALKGSFVDTSISKRIFDICKMVQIDKDIGIVIGKSGIGKTIALREYANRNTEVIYLEADCTYTQTVLLDELMEQLGTALVRGRIHDKQKKIIEILKGSDKLLIIDQAEFLKRMDMEILRTIYDKADIGIVLCGLAELERFLLQMPEYIHTRIGLRDVLGRLTKTDVGVIARNMKQDLSDEIIEILYKETRSNGRGIVKSIKRAYKVAKYEGKKISINIVKKMVEMLRAA